MRDYCPTCDHPMATAQDPDCYAEVWCPRERDCEHPGCMTRSCDSDVMLECVVCALNFCATHTTKIAGEIACMDCAMQIVDKILVDRVPAAE